MVESKMCLTPVSLKFRALASNKEPPWYMSQIYNSTINKFCIIVKLFVLPCVPHFIYQHYMSMELQESLPGRERS